MAYPIFLGMKFVSEPDLVEYFMISMGLYTIFTFALPFDVFLVVFNDRPP